MRGGHVDAVSRTAVSGWAADSDVPDERCELLIEVNGLEVGRARADRPRRDLAALGRYGDGAHGFTFTFATPLAPEREHDVCVYFDDGTLLPGGVRPLPPEGGSRMPGALSRPASPAPERNSSAMAPILVTAPGRSGTTYLMSCLAASPQIVVAELVPYEVRLMSYYAAAFSVLTAPADPERSTHPDRLEGDGFHIGFNPFIGSDQYAHAFRDRALLRDFQDKYAPARLAECVADILREYYRRMAADKTASGANKAGAVYFAEKNNNLHRPTRLFVRRVFPGVREIVIVRDPRDVLCSHMAYFSSSQEKAFHQLSHSCKQLMAIDREAAQDICLIRYEDMIHGDVATFNRMRTFLGAELGPVDSQAGGRMFAQHATSGSPEASIGRWRADLPDALRTKCLTDWGDFLELFGYATT